MRERKAERAANLLRYSDYSLVEIANHLSYSSQSHFIQQFKAITGMTPKQYRDHNQEDVWDVILPPDLRDPKEELLDTGESITG